MTDSKIRALRKLRQTREERVLVQSLANWRILVTNREQVEAGLSLSEPYLLVSVFDPEQGEPALPADPNRSSTLSLSFHDTKRPFDDPAVPAEVQPLTRDQARSIRDFVLGSHAAQVVVVHCHQGMSRSPAIAAAIAAGLGGDPSFWFERRIPNRTVFDTVCAAWLDPE